MPSRTPPSGSRAAKPDDSQSSPKQARRSQAFPIDRKARLRIPPHHVTKQPPFERVSNCA